MVIESCSEHQQHPSAFLRPFPPPALDGVPLSYILDQLHRLAVHYWDKPETADCTIVVPILHAKGKGARTSEPFLNHFVATQPTLPLTPPDTPSDVPPQFPKEPEGAARRISDNDDVMRISRMTSKLHLDYLIAQSSLFRSMFNGQNPLSHLQNLQAEAYGFRRPSMVVPPTRAPRILPSTPSHPVIFVPVPHPASFPHLVHHMYFGTVTILEEALNMQQFTWKQVAENVDYLGMRQPIKTFLGNWYATRISPMRGIFLSQQRQPPSVEQEEGGDGESEEEYDGSVSESESRSSSVSQSDFDDSDLDMDMDMDMDDTDEESSRRMDMSDWRRAIAEEESDSDDDVMNTRRFASSSAAAAGPSRLRSVKSDIKRTTATTTTTPHDVDIDVDVNDDDDDEALESQRHLSHPHRESYRRGRRRGKHQQQQQQMLMMMHSGMGIRSVGALADTSVGVGVGVGINGMSRGSTALVAQEFESESESEPARGRTRVRSRPKEKEVKQKSGSGQGSGSASGNGALPSSASSPRKPAAVGVVGVVGA